MGYDITDKTRSHVNILFSDPGASKAIGNIIAIPRDAKSPKRQTACHPTCKIDLIKRIFVVMPYPAGSPRFLQSLNKFKLLDRLLFCRQPAPGLRLINSHLVTTVSG
jgi:hypothetical protein